MSRILAPALRAFLFAAAILCIFALSNAQTAKAQDMARAFAGTYQISDVAAEGGNVHFTMTLKLSNPGNADVHGGIVVLLNSQPNKAYLGSFSAISTLAHGKQVTVTKTFTVPAAEYAKWQNGHAPTLQFLVPSGETAVAAGIEAHQVNAPVAATN